MAVPFCTACGATIAEGTRFCIKCGQPVAAEVSPPPMPEPAVVAPPVLPNPPKIDPPVVPPPAPPPIAQPPIAPPPIAPMMTAPPVNDGTGAGVWIGILGMLLLVGGAGLWFYTTRVHGFHADSAVQVAAAPTPAAEPAPAPPAAPAPSATPEATPTPDAAPKNPPLPDPIQVETKRQPAPAKPVALNPPPQPAAAPPVSSAPVAEQPPMAQPLKPIGQTSGMLHAAVEVAQNGEVVFENLPGGRLKFTFDHSAWQPTISRQPNGTQTLVMRSLKPGIQTTCDVRWEILQ